MSLTSIANVKEDLEREIQIEDANKIKDYKTSEHCYIMLNQSE